MIIMTKIETLRNLRMQISALRQEVKDRKAKIAELKAQVKTVKLTPAKTAVAATP